MAYRVWKKGVICLLDIGKAGLITNLRCDDLLFLALVLRGKGHCGKGGH